MSNSILLKRSYTPGAVPSPEQLLQGELALNVADSKLYVKNTNNQIVDILFYHVPEASKWELPTQNLSYSGQKISVTVSVDVSFGDPIYIDSTGSYKIADNTNSAKVPCIGLALQSVTAGNKCDVLLAGFIRKDSWNLSPGDNIYLGSGTIATSYLEQEGSIVQYLGRALTSGIIYLFGNTTFIEYEDDITSTLRDELLQLLDGKEDKFDKNTAFNKNFGNEAGTVCEGNDPRLSDDRTPLPHGNEKHTTSFVSFNDVIDGGDF